MLFMLAEDSVYLLAIRGPGQDLATESDLGAPQ